MEPRTYALADPFEGQVVYVVPNYQRLYVWNLLDQWEPLWWDVVALADDLVEHALTRKLESVDPRSVESHFLGAVVLKMSGNTPDLSRQIRVIDGQQRLTTLQLLVAAAAVQIEKAGNGAAADRLKQLIANPSGLGKSPKTRTKISHRRHKRGTDYERFGDVIGAALRGESTVGIVGPMARCYQFFQQRIQTWLGAHETHTDVAAAALATTLIMKLNLVCIYLDPQEREHTIFETLNARGEPLTEWDKIKNFLLSKAQEAPGLEQDSFFEDYLDLFDDGWWRGWAGRGAQYRPRTDIFADYWLESRMNAPVSARRVFREFQSYTNSDGQDLESMAQTLVQDAQYYRKCEKLDSTIRGRERTFHRRRLDMAIGAFWPLLLQLQRLNVDPEERASWLAMLESYFVRRLIVGRQARSYDQVALELLRRIASCGSDQDVGTAIRKQLLNFSTVTTLWPTDNDVEHAVLNRRLSRHARRLVLRAVEAHLIRREAATVGLSPDVEIEHLMPQGWTSDKWPLPKGSEQSVAEQKRNQLIETLGNLTLLNGRINKTISNASWDIKRKVIHKSDNLFVNRLLVERSEHRWTEEDIENRGRWMHRLIVQIWPRM